MITAFPFVSLKHAAMHCLSHTGILHSFKRSAVVCTILLAEFLYSALAIGNIGIIGGSYIFRSR